MRDRTKLLIFIIVFLVLYFAPLQGVNLQGRNLENVNLKGTNFNISVEFYSLGDLLNLDFKILTKH